MFEATANLVLGTLLPDQPRFPLCYQEGLSTPRASPLQVPRRRPNAS